MRVTAIHAQTERKRQDRSARCPEKPGGYRTMTPVDGLIRLNRRPRTGAAVIRSTVRLTRRAGQPILPLTGRPLGECRVIISDMTVLLCGSSQTHLGTLMPLGGGHIIRAKDWHKLKPELFKKQPYYLPGCDKRP